MEDEEPRPERGDSRRPSQTGGLKKLRKSPSSAPSPTWKNDVEHKFEISSIKPIGKGNFAEVFFAKSKDGGDYALKVIAVNKTSTAKYIQTEIDNGIKAVHANVVRLYESINTHRDVVVLVLEYMDVGELYRYIEENGPMDEPTAKHTIHQVFAALAYLHKNHVVHRDVKPENVLLSGKYPFVAKLADLGLSRAFAHDQKMATLCGSPEYCAPEIMEVKSFGKGSYDEKVDIWAAGIVAFVALTAYMPFADDNIILLTKKIQSMTFTWPPHCDVSLAAKSFVNDLLTPVEIRPYANHVLKDAWFYLAELKPEPKKAKEPLATEEIKKKVPRTMQTRFRWKVSVLLGRSE